MFLREISKKVWCLAFLAYLIGCSEREPVEDLKMDHTGNEVTYWLSSASAYNMSGTVTFKERLDSSTDVVIQLDGTTGSAALFPVHLHMGDVTADDADVAALLLPVPDKNGKSETTLRYLADESPISFKELKDLNACIKIHLSHTGEARNVILAAGNVGSAVSNVSPSGRLSIGLCKSE